ncbi:hypothetical protein ACWKWP_02850 [Agromyces soli]
MNRRRDSVEGHEPYTSEGEDEAVNIERAESETLPGLELGASFTFDELIGAIERLRETTIHIVEIPELGDEAGLCALLVEREGEDLIFHAPTESALHRQQFVLHECAHLLLGHIDREDAGAPDFLLPDIPRETRQRLLRRQNLDDPIEIEAEYLADQLAAAIRSSATHDTRFVEIFG